MEVIKTKIVINFRKGLKGILFLIRYCADFTFTDKVILVKKNKIPDLGNMGPVYNSPRGIIDPGDIFSCRKTPKYDSMLFTRPFRAFYM